MPTPRPRVYLAGPMVFDPFPTALFDRMKAICAEAGLEGVAPLDNQIGLEGLPPGRPLLERIVAADIELLNTLDAGLFCLDAFRRGTEMDPGTAFELGYMHALKKPVAGWTSDPRPYPIKVQHFFAQHFNAALSTTEPGPQGGTSGLTRDPDGILVHSETCIQNAMIHIGIELAGGAVTAHSDWTIAFSGAVRGVAAALRK